MKVLQVRSQNNKLQRGDPPITCTALSDDGHRVALGFHNGVVEVVDTELGTTISRSAGLSKPPVWLLFIEGGHKLVIETSEGDIYIWDHFTLHQQRFSPRIDGSTTIVASLSHNGSMIVRAAKHSTKEWYENMYIIHIITDSPTIHFLPTEPHIIPCCGTGRRFPLQRSVGFSPDGQYAAAFDVQHAFIWSCTSFQLIAHYSIEDPFNWFLNTNRPSAMPTLALPNDVIITPFPEHSPSVQHLAYCSTWGQGVPLIPGCTHFPSLLQRPQYWTHGGSSGSGVTKLRLFLTTIVFQDSAQHTGIGIVRMHPRISHSQQARMVHGSFSAMGKVSWCLSTYPGYSAITPHEGIANHQFLQRHDRRQLPYRKGCISGDWNPGVHCGISRSP